MSSFELYTAVFVIALMVAPSLQACAKCDANCPTKDCIAYDVTQQSVCTEVTNVPPASTECRWKGNGLARNTDFELLNGRIIAYKLQWFDSTWSNWFVPEYNDHDCKYNPTSFTCNGKATCAASLRRMWSYFFDHTHSYIICK